MKSCFNYSEKTFLLISISFVLFSFQRTKFEESFDPSKLNKKSNKLTHINLYFLLRKEVIHPHVPVGIPCYDLTPIISPTFDSSLACALGHRLRVLLTLMVWRAVCTRPENVFTAACWSAITSDSNFTKSNCRLRSELRRNLWVLLHIAILHLVVYAIVVRV